jgi:hypothetical protein
LTSNGSTRPSSSARAASLRDRISHAGGSIPAETCSTTCTRIKLLLREKLAVSVAQ